MESTPYKYNFNQVNSIPMGLTFDDILLVPQYSSINSRSECIVRTKFSKNIPLNIPIVSSPMDTVTEWKLAKEMARNGGLGIIHRFMSDDEQAQQVAKVKRAQAHVLFDPILVSEKTTYRQIKELGEQYGFMTFLVTDKLNEKKQESPQKLSHKKNSEYSDSEPSNQLKGIITKRDIKNFKNDNDIVSMVMTPRDRLTVLCSDVVQVQQGQVVEEDQVLETMFSKRVEKLPIVDANNNIIGLVTRKDIERSRTLHLANKDPNGQLLVGAAIGAKEEDIERAAKLIKFGVDVLVLDIANGHSQLCIDAVKKFKEQFEGIDLVAGSIATGQGAENLIKAGADGIRCGIGNGSICITRVVSGCGVPQFSALLDTAPICKQYGIPLNSDGGNRCSGNMVKALTMADSIMVGRLIAGCDESPSEIIYKDGKLSKIFRGMAGLLANTSKAARMGDKIPSTQTFNAEGVEGYIPYAGSLQNVLSGFVKGIQSGMSYQGAKTLSELKKNAQFIRMSQSAFKESGVHSINLMK